MGVAANVRTFGDGSVLTAPLGTALPAAVDTAPNVAFIDLGFLTEDGIGHALNTSVSDYKIWQNAAVVATSVTDSSVEVSFAMAEDSEIVKTVFYGAAATAGVRNIDPAVRYRGAWILHLVDTAGDAKRFLVADGEVINREEVTASNAGPSVYGVTIKAYPSSALGGAPFRELTEAA